AVPIATLSYAAQASYMHVCAIARARATIGGPSVLSRTSANAVAFQSLTMVARAGDEDSPMAARMIAMIFAFILRLAAGCSPVHVAREGLTARGRRAGARGYEPHIAAVTWASKRMKLPPCGNGSDRHSPPTMSPGDAESRVSGRPAACEERPACESSP